MIKELLESEVIETPWPILIEKHLVSGTKVKPSLTCNDTCRTTDVIGMHTCEHNLTHFTREFSGMLITVCDLYIQSSNATKQSNKNLKIKERRVSKESVFLWFKQFETKLISIESVINLQAKKRFDPFHEFVKWANEIKFYSSRLINKDGFEKSSENLKSLHKTSVMLMDSLDTAALYVNPESASFGRKRETDLYSMIHKISIVLSHSKTNKNRVKINLIGRVKNLHRVFESFKIIPLSLIQNAVKYRKCNDIEVVFDERDTKLEFSVVSYGDLISEDEIKSLFKRGYRTKKAASMKVEGSGLGLYALKVVAEAHEFQVTVRSEVLDTTRKNIARNIFTVSIY